MAKSKQSKFPINKRWMNTEDGLPDPSLRCIGVDSFWRRVEIHLSEDGRSWMIPGGFRVDLHKILSWQPVAFPDARGWFPVDVCPPVEGVRVLLSDGIEVAAGAYMRNGEEYVWRLSESLRTLESLPFWRPLIPLPVRKDSDHAA